MSFLLVLLLTEKVGEALGMHEEFYLRVLHHYCRLFDFAGFSFEEAFRQFLLAFRLPGASIGP